MRGRAIGIVAVLAGATAVAAVVGTARAQVLAQITVTPAVSDPGGVVQVSNGVASPCAPPGGAGRPSASVDLFAAGSATPVNRAPYQGAVTASGTWSVEVRLAPDIPPGGYRVQAGCYTDSGLNSRFGPAYEPGRLDVRQQDPGQPVASDRRASPGDTIQVGSGDARCAPPVGSPSPRVRVSLLDAAQATRAEAEGPVDPATGRWSVGIRVPDVVPQSAQITAVCLARVGAPAPYARYSPAPFTVEADLQPATTTTAPATTAPATTLTPGAPAPAPPPTSATPAPAAALPATPIAVPIVAEPTYTG